MFSSQVFSETYVCSHVSESNFLDVEKGEVDFDKFERDGDHFFLLTHSGERGMKFETTEDDKMIVLTDVSDLLINYLVVEVYFINKETKDYVYSLLDFERILKNSSPYRKRGRSTVVE